LIKFATLVKDQQEEFNPYEAKQNPIIPVERDGVQEVDPYWNRLRVLPPESLTYPDFERDGSDFYDIICCLKLKKKYAPQSVRSDQLEEIARDFKAVV